MILFSGNALAHKVNIFAYAEDGVVYTESYFSEGKKVVNSKIEVFDAKNNKLLITGETDGDGKFSFDVPKPTGLRIVLTASMGHKNEYLLSEEEVREALGTGKGSVKSAVKPKIKIKPSIRDIIAGIGYILGLMGIGIYIKYRRASRTIR